MRIAQIRIRDILVVVASRLSIGCQLDIHEPVADPATLDGALEDLLNGFPLDAAAIGKGHVVEVLADREVDLGPEVTPVGVRLACHVLEFVSVGDREALHYSVRLGSNDGDVPLRSNLVLVIIVSRMAGKREKKKILHVGNRDSLKHTSRTSMGIPGLGAKVHWWRHELGNRGRLNSRAFCSGNPTSSAMLCFCTTENP